MIRFIYQLSLSKKRFIVFLYDALIALISFPLAIAIRYSSFDVSDYKLPLFYKIVLALFLIKIGIFLIMKLSRGIWRFSSTPDLLLILKAVTLAAFVSLIVLFLWMRLENIPRSSLVIDWFLTVFFLGGGRFSYRIWKEGRRVKTNLEKTIIIGAGTEGEQLVREIKSNTNTNIFIVGILDDNKERHGRTIHSIPILGEVKDLPLIATQQDVTNVIIALHHVSAKTIRDIVNICHDNSLKVKTLPSLTDIVDGKVYISALRPINLEDLLGRSPVNLDMEAIGKLIRDKIILVTGAGGSIGNELCNQILKFHPKKLILFEICEYFIYNTEQTLSESFPDANVIPVVGDVRDKSRVYDTISKYAPDIVFHAAAYKHVPMMELNPGEAVKTNVVGTRILAEACSDLQVPRFVMISTDKAVNPTNIMGTTKKIAEMICLKEHQKGHTSFTILRFGNVLGSTGSVIPRFKQQILNGGPVTVTHPDITRYFMSIPEAAQLVLQAGTLGNGGEIFVLEMGNPVKIVDLARDLIKLSGYEPDKDIEIRFTGLRPGEKLFEELLADNENTLPTKHAMVRVAKARDNDIDFEAQLDGLLDLDQTQETIKENLKKLVPEYSFKENFHE